MGMIVDSLSIQILHEPFMSFKIVRIIFALSSQASERRQISPCCFVGTCFKLYNYNFCFIIFFVTETEDEESESAGEPESEEEK